MDTLQDLTDPQRAALLILNEAATGDGATWWRRQWAIGGASRNVLAALMRRRLIVQRIERTVFEWRITERGRRLVSESLPTT